MESFKVQIFKLGGTVLGLALMAAPISNAYAEHHEGHGGYNHGGHWVGGPHWHGEISHFHQYDVNIWRGGRWSHSWHGGRLGWWWILGGAWYFYPSPVYPYPDPYEPPVVVVQQEQAPPPQQYWYYCADPAGYYPYVPNCRVNWQPVQATPSWR